MSMEKMKLAALAMTVAFGLAACEKPKTAETAGEKIDQAAEKAGEKMDRAAEKAGEKMEDASKKLGEQATKAGEAMEDTTITTKIKSAILAEPGLKVLQINVDTMNGVVTLTGTVDSQASSDKAAQVAGAVSGVKQVENRLVVKSPS